MRVVYTKPATPAVALAVTKARVADDGRSEWQWFVLDTGNLVLGTYPTGETYEAVKVDADPTKVKGEPSMTTKSRPARWAEGVAAAKAALSGLRETAPQALRAALADLNAVKSEYEDWQSNLPENLQSGTLADKLSAVVDLDLSEDFDLSDLDTVESALDEAENVDLPRGFGRD